MILMLKFTISYDNIDVDLVEVDMIIPIGSLYEY
jgi:hypothetical protein